MAQNVDTINQIIAVWCYCRSDYNHDGLSSEIKGLLLEKGVMVKDEGDCVILNLQNNTIKNLIYEVDSDFNSLESIMLSLFVFENLGRNVWPAVVSSIMINRQAMDMYYDDFFVLSATDGEKGVFTVKLKCKGIDYVYNLWNRILEG